MRFTQDNTEGYTDDHLTIANERFEKLMHGQWGMGDHNDRSYEDWVAEKVLKELDDEICK